MVEEAKAAEFAAPEGFEELERRVYDDTEFVFCGAAETARGVLLSLPEADPKGERQGSTHLLPNSFSISESFNST